MLYSVSGIGDWKATEEVFRREAPETLAEIRQVLKTRLIKKAALSIRIEGEKTIVRVDCTKHKELF